MIPIITRHWWVLSIRGALAIAFGVLAIAFPPATFVFLAVFVAAYLALDGVFAIVAGIRAAESHRRWWPFALEGIANLFAGAIVFVAPGTLIYLVGFWAIATGLLLLIPALSLPTGSGRWLLALNGAVSLVFGVLIVAQPEVGLLFVIWAVAIYALLFGAGLLLLSVSVRALHRSHALHRTQPV
jgi:uncharacterized membrane protein HdeD (DUF308 family)